MVTPGEFFVCTADIPRGSGVRSCRIIFIEVYLMFSKVEFMLDMYDDIDWMDEPTETGWMPAPEQVEI